MKIVKKIFCSYKSIIVLLSILVIILLAFNLYIVKTTKIYSFSGTHEKLAILPGTIYIGYNINRFQAPQIVYNGENITLKSGVVGYYIESEPISIFEFNTELKLKDILNSHDFSFTEMHRKAQKLSKSKLDRLENLMFSISAEKKDGEDFVVEVPLKAEFLGK